MNEPLILPDELRCGMVMAAQNAEGITDLSRRIEAAGHKVVSLCEFEGE